MNIAIWTVATIAIYAKIKSEIRVFCLCAEILAGLIFLVIHGLFILEIHGSLRRSLIRMRNMADNILQNRQTNILNFSFFDNPQHPIPCRWEFLQLAISATLMVIYISIRK
ncbi:MAG TPA: hypothetical protein VMT76_17335 [Puia sp.]|nr:hypothetical protein [Puia sp.]